MIEDELSLHTDPEEEESPLVLIDLGHKSMDRHKRKSLTEHTSRSRNLQVCHPRASVVEKTKGTDHQRWMVGLQAGNGARNSIATFERF